MRHNILHRIKVELREASLALIGVHLSDEERDEALRMVEELRARVLACSKNLPAREADAGLDRRG